MHQQFAHPVPKFKFSLKHKRWSCAAVSFRGDEHLLVIGGRGKWVGNSVEVFDPDLQSFSLTPNGPMMSDRTYTATVVCTPHKRFNTAL